MKIVITRLLIILLLFVPNFLKAQEDMGVTKKSNKGKLYAFWGWNRGWYSDSDIRFTGENYDFTLNNVSASDRQSKVRYNTYFKPSRITIPQTNLRIGYFISDKYDISIGVDHMKYVMNRVQDVKINGFIHDGSEFDNDYTNDDFHIDKPFLQFEHTDGLNYLNIEITRNDDLMDLLKWQLNPNKIQINTLLGFGAGAVMPKSNVTLWNTTRYDEFHFAGYGFAGKIGLNFTFYKYFFLRAEYKGGFIDMPDIRTSSNPLDRAEQHFFFTELVTAFGFVFPLY